MKNIFLRVFVVKKDISTVELISIHQNSFVIETLFYIIRFVFLSVALSVAAQISTFRQIQSIIDICESENLCLPEFQSLMIL